MTEVTTEIPRSRSIFIQSERVLRRSPLALTWPARLMAPPNSSSFSVSVVLPASGCEMMAKVRRRATSAARGERYCDSVVRARSDIRLERLAGKAGRIKQDRGLIHIWDGADFTPVGALKGPQQHGQIIQRGVAGGGRNRDHPSIDDRPRHVPADRRDPPGGADADDGARDGVG